MTMATANDFWTTLERSGLLSPEAWNEARKIVGDDPASGDPNVVSQQLVDGRWLTRFQVKQLLAGRYRGFFIADKFKILELLGEGGMGRVVLCEHLLLRRLVALKVMHAHYQRRPGAKDRFLREARAAASLQHPNIAQVFDVDQSELGPYIVMEYIDGVDMHRLTARHGPFSPSRAANFIRQAAAGLQHAHEAGLVHRDIKAVNLMLDRHGTVKLLDLGLARFFDNETNDQLTKQHDVSAIIGTADFIAPEQVLASSKADIRADIYSLGLTLYFFLTRRLPFPETNTIQKLLYHQVREPEPVATLRTDVPADLLAVLERMIKKNPADRYQTPQEVVDALTPWSKEPLSSPTEAEMPKITPSSFRLGLSPAKPRGPALRSSASALPSQIRSEMPTDVEGSLETNARSGITTSSLVSGPRSSPSHEKPMTSQVDDWLAAELPPPKLPAAAAMPTRNRPTPALGPMLSRGGKISAALRRNWKLYGGGGVGLLILLVVVRVLIGTLFSRGDPALVQGKTPVAVLPAESTSESTAAPVSDVILHGGGSTFVRPMIEHWAEIYRKQTGVRVEYGAVGSSKGVQGFTSKLLDFACSDAYLSDEQIVEAGGRVVHIPLVMGAVVPTYNLPDSDGAREPVRFTGPILANIYLGKITNWNDPALAVSNPGKKFPDLPITVVYRKDGSGTTSIWTDYLSKTGSAWKDQIGRGTSVKWPVGVGAEKNDGVADAVSRTGGAIGYVELSYALANGLPFGAVKNSSGEFVTPSIAGVTAAAAGSLASIPDDLRYSLTDAPGRASYPIVGTAWALIYVDQSSDKGRELAQFFRWATTEGQVHAASLMYGNLPPELGERISKSLDLVAGRR